MREFLVCDMCTATISTENAVCEFCGNDYKNSGSSGRILRLKDEIEKHIYTSNNSKILHKISQSKYKEHPIILYRKAKIILLEYMTDDGVLDSQEFIEVINIINNISRTSEDYWSEFILYLSVLFPTNHTQLFLEDFKLIHAHLISINRNDRILKDKMIQQVLINIAGYEFFKDFLFYTNDKNYINHQDFLFKKEHLKNKYESLLNEIEKTL